MAEQAVDALHYGAVIRATRERGAVSLRELARRIDVSPATLSAVETGRTALTVDRLGRIAQALGVAPAGLLSTPGHHAVHESARGERSTTDRRDWRVFEPLDLDPVITAAIEVFVATGYHGATVRQIARAAGASVAGIYHHYPSKQDLLVTILDRTMADLRWRVLAAREEVSTAPTRFERMVEALALFHATRQAVAFIGASEMRSLDEPNRSRIAALRTEIQHLLDSEAEHAVQEGAFTTTNVRAAGRAVATMCTSLAQWYRPDGLMSPEQVARDYARFAIGMMLTR